MAELQHVTPDSFDDEVVRAETPVLLDFWGPRCGPCIQLDPFMADLSKELEGRVRVMKVVAPEARKLCIDLKVGGLPTIVAFAGGEEVGRLTGEISREEIRTLAAGLAAYVTMRSQQNDEVREEVTRNA